MGSEQFVVFVTAPKGELAAQIAHALVGEKLAACVNILPSVRSIYTWDDAVQDDEEQLLIIKTTAERYPALEARVRALHSYEVAEIIALPIVRGSADYLSWLTAGCRP
ncbi:MAG: divalent-cation tolerance protein CutA [bacterium]